MKNPYFTAAIATLAACVYAPPTIQAQGKASQNRPGERDDRAPGHSDHPQ